MLRLQKAMGSKGPMGTTHELGPASVIFFRHVRIWVVGGECLCVQKTRRNTFPVFYQQNNSIQFPNPMREILPGFFAVLDLLPTQNWNSVCNAMVWSWELAKSGLTLMKFVGKIRVLSLQSGPLEKRKWYIVIRIIICWLNLDCGNVDEPKSRL